MASLLKTVLFVDDEPQLLSALKRGLRKMKNEWTLLFAGSGQEALSLLKEHSTDAVLTDMRMPGMDGAELIAEIRYLQPSTLRLGLSGYGEAEQILSSALFFHQFWSKPCGCEVIIDRLQRYFSLGDLLPKDVRDVLTTLDFIPIPEERLRSFSSEISKAEMDIEAVQAYKNSDLGLYLILGKLLNSNFLGAPRDFESPSDLALSLPWLIQLFQSSDILSSVGRIQGALRPSPSVEMASQLAASDGSHRELVKRVRIAAHLWDLRPFLSDLTSHSDQQTLNSASAFLASIWGFSEDIVSALLPGAEVDHPVRRYLDLAERNQVCAS